MAIRRWPQYSSYYRGCHSVSGSGSSRWRGVEILKGTLAQVSMVISLQSLWLMPIAERTLAQRLFIVDSGHDANLERDAGPGVISFVIKQCKFRRGTLA
ncbi:hypothetical protein AVEN_272837-1, partial [Araneus ventricosus]